VPRGPRKAVGLVIFGFGLALLILPTTFVMWAHHMYNVGVGAALVALVAIPGIVVSGLGALLAWIGSRRTN